MTDTASQRRTKALVVDDTGVVRALFELALASAGYDVLGTAWPSDALAACATSTPDVAFIDIFLQRESSTGLELIRAIHAEYPTVRIVAMSGGGPSGDFDVLLRAKDLGARATLAKPIRWEQILEVVQQVLAPDR